MEIAVEDQKDMRLAEEQNFKTLVMGRLDSIEVISLGRPFQMYTWTACCRKIIATKSWQFGWWHLWAIDGIKSKVRQPGQSATHGEPH